MRSHALATDGQDGGVSYQADERIVTYPTERIELTARVAFATVRSRLEDLVPEVDTDELRRLVDEGAPWEDFTRVARRAPYDLMRYPGVELAAMMRIAGVGIPSISYELTNHALLARMFRHDPGVALYAPFRLALHGSGDASTVVALDRPSARLVSFGNNKIAQVGVELDRAIGDLLEAVDLPRPSVLRR